MLTLSSFFDLHFTSLVILVICLSHMGHFLCKCICKAILG